MTRQQKHTVRLVLLCGLLVSTHVLAEDTIDWNSVPQSQLPARVADIVCELEPVLAQKKSVLLPLPPVFAGVSATVDKRAQPAPPYTSPIPARQKRNVRKGPETEAKKEIPPVVWNFDAYFAEVFTNMMAAAKLAVADPQPCLDLLPDKPAKRQNLNVKLIQKIAKKADAGMVLIPQLLFRKAAVTLQVSAYDGESGKVVQTASGPLKGTDLDYLANTPNTNRKTVQWVESRFGQKIDRGECWDLVAKGVIGGGTSWGPKDPFDFGRRLQPEETPFPGDPLATKNRSHTMMTYRYKGDGKLTILQQNWDWGKENGRKVGWGNASIEGNDFWRLRPAPGDAFADVMQTAKAKAEEKRGKTEAEAESKEDRKVEGGG